LEYTNRQQRNLSRLANRIGGYRNGNLQGTNIIPNRYKQEDPNFDQNSKETVGVISPDEAEELIAKHNINKNDLATPKRLGKRPFTLQQVNGNYIRKRI